MNCIFIKTTNPNMQHHVGQEGQLTYKKGSRAIFLPSDDPHHTMLTSYVIQDKKDGKYLELSTENSKYIFELLVEFEREEAN